MCGQEAKQFAEEHKVELLRGPQLYLINELTPTDRQIVETRVNEQKLKTKPLPPSHRGISRGYW